MSDLFWLTDAQMARLAPYFPKSRGKPRVNDRRVMSGIIFINPYGLQWRDAPREYGPHKTLYNRWSDGVMRRLCQDYDRSGRRAWREKDRDDRRNLSQGSQDSNQYGRGRLIGRTKGGMNTKLHAICDSKGQPLDLFVTTGQVRDYIGSRALLKGLRQVDWLLGDRGYDQDWFRQEMKDKGIPSRKQRKVSVKYDKRRYKSRYRIEIMFGRHKD